MAEIDLYNFSEWQEAEIVIEPAGKAPKHYGEGVYRFYAAMTLSVILPRRGWEIVKKTKDYAYIRPPGPPPYIVKIKVPSKAQAIELAHSIYIEKEGEDFQGKAQFFQAGELPCFYTHRKPGNHSIHIPGDGDKPHQHIPTTIPESWLIMGEFGFWKIELKSFDVDWTYYPHGKLNNHPTQVDSLFEPVVLTPEVLVEGAAMEIAQTEYKRNRVARNPRLK